MGMFRDDFDTLLKRTSECFHFYNKGQDTVKEFFFSLGDKLGLKPEIIDFSIIITNQLGDYFLNLDQKTTLYLKNVHKKHFNIFLATIF